MNKILIITIALVATVHAQEITIADKNMDGSSVNAAVMDIDPSSANFMKPMAYSSPTAGGLIANIANPEVSVSPAAAQQIMTKIQEQQTGPWYTQTSSLLCPAITSAWNFGRIFIPVISALLLTFTIFEQLKTGDGLDAKNLLYRTMTFVIVFGGATTFFHQLKLLQSNLPTLVQEMMNSGANSAIFSSNKPTWDAQLKVQAVFESARQAVVAEAIRKLLGTEVATLDLRYPVTDITPPNIGKNYYKNSKTKAINAMDVAYDLIMYGSASDSRSLLAKDNPAIPYVKSWDNFKGDTSAFEDKSIFKWRADQTDVAVPRVIEKHGVVPDLPNIQSKLYTTGLVDLAADTSGLVTGLDSNFKLIENSNTERWEKVSSALNNLLKVMTYSSVEKTVGDNKILVGGTSIAQLYYNRIYEVSGLDPATALHADVNPTSSGAFRKAVIKTYQIELERLGVIPPRMTRFINYSGSAKQILMAAYPGDLSCTDNPTRPTNAAGVQQLEDGKQISKYQNFRLVKGDDIILFERNKVEMQVSSEKSDDIIKAGLVLSADQDKEANNVQATMEKEAEQNGTIPKTTAWSDLAGHLKDLILDIITGLGNIISKGALLFFTMIYGLLFDIQFTIVMLCLPFLFSSKLEGAFKSQLKHLGYIVLIPAVAGFALGVWAAFYQGLLGGVLNTLLPSSVPTAGGAVKSVLSGILLAQGFGFQALVGIFLMNIIATIMILMKVKGWTESVATGGAIAGSILKSGVTAVAGGALAGLNVGLAAKAMKSNGVGNGGPTPTAGASTPDAATASTVSSVGSSSSATAKLPSPANAKTGAKQSESVSSSGANAEASSTLGRTPRPAKASAITTPSGQTIEPSTLEQKREAFLGDRMPGLIDPAPASGPASTEPSSPPSRQSIASSLFNRAKATPDRLRKHSGDFVRGNGGDRNVAKMAAQLYQHARSTIDIANGDYSSLKNALDKHVDKHTKEEAERN